MAMIEGFRVGNYKVLRDVTLGRLWNQREYDPLTPLVAVIGKNGSGKSTLFDAFGFVSDALERGVEEAFDLKGRGGFKKSVSSGSEGHMEFEIYYRESKQDRPITYEISIGLDRGGRPYVQRERLRQRRKGQSKGHPFSFLYLVDGVGYAWKGEESYSSTSEETHLDKGDLRSLEETAEKTAIELTDKRRLGVSTLAALKDHPRIDRFVKFLKGWYLSYFTPDAARGLPMSGPQAHLNVHGDNLSNVVQYMERDHPNRFREILKRIAEKIPGIDRIETQKTDDGRVLLCFNDKGFEDPFFAQQMSDGTLKLFTYMILLEDPEPRPFICIEEPENGLYHKLLETLVNEFRSHATGKKNSPQIFLTTHQPHLVDALSPHETWILEKGDDGFSKIRRASDDPLIQEFVNQEIPLGALWFSDYLDVR